MHLVTALAAGVRGGENGTAEIYRRGTQTRASWYTDSIATSTNASGDDVDLDANGGFTLYVNEVVDIIVKDSLGVAVRTFTDGYSAPGVEYRGQSFTGTHPVTGESGAGSNYPITAQEIFDLWKDSAGATDFKVLFNGAATLLTSIVGNLLGLVFNVKDSAYGAVGDGSTDDTAAINAAITAATASGGTVFFPAGTYRVTSLITVQHDVNLVGAGSEFTAILTDHATAGTLSYNAAGSGNHASNLLSGLRIGASQANTGARVNIVSGGRVVIDRCRLGSTTNSNGYALLIASSATTRLHVRDSILVTNASNSSVVRGLQSGGRSVFERCYFVESATSYTPADTGAGMVSGIKMTFIDCEFDASAATAGTFTYYYSESTTLDAVFRGNRFLATGGATATAFELGAYTATSFFSEEASTFGASVTAYSYTHSAVGSGGAHKGAQVRLRSRETRRTFVTTATNSLSIPNKEYGLIETEITGAFTVLIFPQHNLPEGAETIVTVRNQSGAARTVDGGQVSGGGVTDEALVMDSISLDDNREAVVRAVSLIGQIDVRDPGVDKAYQYGFIHTVTS
jgi:hypothetical protein